MDPAGVDTSEQALPGTIFFDRLQSANHGSLWKDKDLRHFLSISSGRYHQDVPVLKLKDRTYSLRVEQETFSHGIEPEKGAWSSLYNIVCPNRSSFQSSSHNDGDLNLLECVNSNVEFVNKEHVPSSRVPSIFLALGPIIEEARSLNNRFEYRDRTNFKLLWNLSTRPTSLWVMYDYYDENNYDTWEWNKLNEVEEDIITEEEKRDILSPCINDGFELSKITKIEVGLMKHEILGIHIPMRFKRPNL